PLGGPFDRRVRLGIEQLADKIVRPRDARNFSAAASGALTPRLVRKTDASVVNVHWTGYGAASSAQMGRLNTPAVWTLHDMWTLGGGEHYYNPGDERANGSWVLDRKERHWRQPRLLITPSTWLREQAAKSPIVSHWPIRVIPNPLDTRWPTGQPHPHVAILGHERAPMSWTGLPFDTHWLGRTFDDEHIALSYAAADVVVVPSRMDNLPQVATEAAACGRPVVAFDIGGLSDAVADRRSG
ncbi:MAG: glycosyltransferase, partial [Actinomycetota bacterium]